jgi:hypothetical protein
VLGTEAEVRALLISERENPYEMICPEFIFLLCSFSRPETQQGRDIEK